jgi:hypothetical protein
MSIKRYKNLNRLITLDLKFRNQNQKVVPKTKMMKLYTILEVTGHIFCRNNQVIAGIYNEIKERR